MCIHRSRQLLTERSMIVPMHARDHERAPSICVRKSDNTGKALPLIADYRGISPSHRHTNSTFQKFSVAVLFVACGGATTVTRRRTTRLSRLLRVSSRIL
ncbi:hypothetical protein EVAR_103519_1 [Eumeta japonica]|uniref:Uncharacterized protein n=1 Tax=Eumeta variegata TaxID=151549 RepID=A0A4C1YWA4_EUMVA|nr:hypothetical protein EVAR_103519_1 [Eumeta japonica]